MGSLPYAKDMNVRTSSRCGFLLSVVKGAGAFILLPYWFRNLSAKNCHMEEIKMEIKVVKSL